jgi:NADH:ubiquinone oxidoreductase subunit 5 (subunit L)/multisubunit Na+/H+ antiporter MnhA subunit
VYLGFLEAMGRPGGDLLAFAAFGVPVLAVAGGLAAACFAKVVGVAFLGSARSAGARDAHEAPRSMLVPMGLLASACLVIGLAPPAVLPPLARAAAGWSRLDPAALAGPAARAGEGAWRVSLVAAVLVLAASVLAAGRRRRLTTAPRAAPAQVPTWGCGFAAPTARMQYTASSFADLLVSRFSWAIFRREAAPRIDGPFPGPSELRTEVPDTVLDLVLLPVAKAYGWLAARARPLVLQRIQFQMLLVLLTLVAMLALGFAR